MEEVPVNSLHSARPLDPSPPPPLTARVVAPALAAHHTEQHVDPSASPSPSASQQQRSRRSATADGDQRRSDGSASQAGGPLASRTVNRAPVLQYKRRPASRYAIPAPDFDWEASPTQHDTKEKDEKQQKLKEGTHDEEAAEAAFLTEAQPPSHPSLRSSGGGSASAARRSSVLGPDPRDCVDSTAAAFHDEHVTRAEDADDAEAEPEVLRVAPLPQWVFQRSRLTPTPPPPSTAQPEPTCAALDDDLSALVNAAPVDRCRSDSRGQIALVEAADTSVDATRGSDDYRATVCAHLAAPTAQESTEAADGARRPSPSPPSADVQEAEFVHEYFYYPACDGDDVPEAPADEQTPVRHRRAASASPSSSMPRWTRSLANETPFTPFAFNPAAGGAAMASASATPVVPRHTTTTNGEIGSSGLAFGDGGQQRCSVLDSLLPSATQRLTVQDVVAAVLTAAPPLPPVVMAAPAPARDSTVPDKEDVSGFDGPLDEPAPRPPTDCGVRRHAPPSVSPSQPAPQGEREQLTTLLHGARARLLHADQLCARFDAVIAARQAELEAATAKYEELAQQTESHATRAAMARKEVRRLRDRQHTREELQLLQDMLVDKENRLSVAQSRLLSLKRLWQQLELLHTASAVAVSEPHRSRVEEVGEGELDSPSSAFDPCTTTATTTQSAGGDATAHTGTAAAAGTSASEVARLLPLSPPSGDKRAVPLLPACPPRSAASGAELERHSGDAQSNTNSSPAFIDTPASEEEETQEAVYPQSPLAECEDGQQRSASCASSSASSLASLNTLDVLDDFLDELLMEVDGLAKVCIQLPSPPPNTSMSFCNRLKPPTHGSSSQQQQQGRARTTYSTLNRRLNIGNNGFFSFFGGATEAHLNSKPLSTFLANLDRLRRSSWELEEEVQLRARELATDLEEEELKARLSREYGLAAKPDDAEGPQEGGLRSPTTPLPNEQLESSRDAALCLSGESDPLAATTASADRTTRQLFLSSPEHGRRSKGGSSGGAAGGLLSPVSASPLSSHGRPLSIQLLLPTLVYAYPRVAAVSQHLDAEQQTIQQEYAAAIAAARLQRRELTAKMREAFRVLIAPPLQRRVQQLREEQARLALELGELGVKEVVLEWEEEEPAAMDEAAMGQLMDSMTAQGKRQLLGPRRRGNGHAGRSRSRLSAYSCSRDSSGYGSEASHRGVSQGQTEGGHGLEAATAGAATPPCEVYRRTLRVLCSLNDAVQHEQEKEGVAASSRSSRQSGQYAQQLQQRSARQRTPVHSGRRSSAAVAGGGERASRNLPPPRPSAAGPPLTSQGQRTSTAAATAATAKSCAALQLYTHAPSPQLITRTHKQRVSGNGEEDQHSKDAAFAKPQQQQQPRRVAHGRTSAVRISSGTPRVSGAAAASLTARSSTASGRVSTGGAAPPSPRHTTRHTTAAESCAVPLVVDSRTLLVSEAPRLSTPLAAGPFTAAAAGGAGGATPMAGTSVWSPFQPTHNALADGAVRVAVTFGGAEARRRQAAHARQSAYQREFWALREELARIDEDIFQLRTRHSDLCSQQLRLEAEQAGKLAEAEAKVRKCRAFYKTLKRENKEWQDIRDELQRVMRDGE